jgi:hypothetical protein
MPILHGAQALAGYLLMLIAMTYSVELLLSVIAGLGVGYRLFFYRAPATHSSANPCCDFLEERKTNGDTNNSNTNGNSHAAASSDPTTARHDGECCDPLLPQHASG